jgi:hypothetical protein
LDDSLEWLKEWRTRLRSLLADHSQSNIQNHLMSCLKSLTLNAGCGSLSHWCWLPWTLHASLLPLRTHHQKEIILELPPILYSDNREAVAEWSNKTHTLSLSTKKTGKQNISKFPLYKTSCFASQIPFQECVTCFSSSWECYWLIRALCGSPH